MDYKHFMYCPFTGLGRYDGFRGNTWLKNSIKIFKQFVVPSLQAQTCKDFTLWCSWRREEKHNPHVRELTEYLDQIQEFKTIHTYGGVCFYDDKYPDQTARERLIISLQGAIMEKLINETEGERGYEWVYMTIQPSDDCYHKNAVAVIQDTLRDSKFQAVGFQQGYVANYQTKEVAEYNPTTNPPFYTIKFPRPVFVEAYRHAKYTALKHDVGQYKAGTPLPSHEYVGHALNYAVIKGRWFLVGTHGVNISTTWQIPFKGEAVSGAVLDDFGIGNVPPLQISVPLLKKLYISLPHKVQRKLRYFREKFR